MIRFCNSISQKQTANTCVNWLIILPLLFCFIFLTFPADVHWDGADNIYLSLRYHDNNRAAHLSLTDQWYAVFNDLLSSLHASYVDGNQLHSLRGEAKENCWRGADPPICRQQTKIALYIIEVWNSMSNR